MHTIVFIKKNFMKCVRNEIISGISKHVILKYREWLEWTIRKSIKSRQYWKTLNINVSFFKNKAHEKNLEAVKENKQVNK